MSARLEIVGMLRRATAAILIVVAGLAAVGAESGETAVRPTGVDKLFILDCGHGVAGDSSFWSPGVDVGKPRNFVNSCYLIHHTRGWLLWDTGVADAIAQMPDGLVPASPRTTHWFLRTTLASQLKRLGLAPSDIAWLAISHAHPDHVGNVALFPKATLLVQRAEYSWLHWFGLGPFAGAQAVIKLDGDYDVFGDGSVMAISTPGHTPGHQCLLVKLPKTGALLLTGDAVHFQSNWDNHRVPNFSSDIEQAATSMKRMAEILTQHKAQLWINHDQPQRDSLRLAPDFYE